MDATTELLNQEAEQDMTPWWALRLHFVRHKVVGEWLAEQGLEYFVPMRYVDIEYGGKVKHVLRPVVSNLIFVKKSVEEGELRSRIAAANLRMSFVTRSRESRIPSEIPAQEMREFITMCNPEVELRKYLSENEAKMKAGMPVLVKYGPLKGLSGKLVRSSKKYYLLKEVPGMAVMMKVSRWCCVPLEG